jgi:transposase
VSETISMSRRELSRVEVMQQLKAKRISQSQAAEQLGLTVRQIKRLWRAYRTGGAQALVSKRRGRPSNHQLNADVKNQALKLIESRYPDFGPTLAHEKLTEVHHLTLGRETLRQLMVTAGHWEPHPAKTGRAHPMRPRRPRRGELVQIDGSPHAWFEDRGPACTLLAYIDDATGQVLELFFTPAETTFSYFAATRRYLTQYGKPLAFYSDKHGIFRVNAEAAVTGTGVTQFGRAMTELGIEIICANSPQAKGRVERLYETLQDRLVKELRLRGISDLAAANAFMPEYRADYNRRFGVVPTDLGDAHRPLLPADVLDQIFTLQTQRIISKNLTFQYAKIVYQLEALKGSYAFRGAQVVVREDALGAVTVSYQGRQLAYSIFEPQVRQAEVVSSKQVDQALAVAKAKQAPFIPAANHPWRKYGQPLSPKR